MRLIITIEGLPAKRAYIDFWPIFIFCRSELTFGRLPCFDGKGIAPNRFGRFALRSAEITYAKKLSCPLETFVEQE